MTGIKMIHVTRKQRIVL